MRKLIAFGIFLILTLVSAVHVYWAFGGLWPASSPQAFSEMVVGDPRFDRIPPASMTLVVAALIFCAGIVGLVRARVMPLPFGRLWGVGTLILALVFLSRAGYGIAIASGAIVPEVPLTEPFATLDLQFYSPLCVLIGAGFLVLATRSQEVSD